MTQKINMNGVLEHLDAGTLVRNSFGGTYDKGRKTACLYSAMVTGTTDTDNCPADAMPQWMADLTPLINDRTSPEKWESLMLRYGRAAKRWHVLSTKQWDKTERLFKAECIAIALRAASKSNHKGYGYWPKVQNACLKIETALRNNLPITREMKAEAEAAAAAAARSAAEAAAAWSEVWLEVWLEAEAERSEVWLEVWLEAEAARSAAEAAEAWSGVWSAARSAAEAEAWSGVWSAAEAAEAAEAETWDHLCDHLLVLIEAEIANVPSQKPTDPRRRLVNSLFCYRRLVDDLQGRTFYRQDDDGYLRRWTPPKRPIFDREESND